MQFVVDVIWCKVVFFFFQLQVVPGQKTGYGKRAGLHLQPEQLRISLSTETGKKMIYFRSDSVS